MVGIAVLGWRLVGDAVTTISVVLCLGAFFAMVVTLCQQVCVRKQLTGPIVLS